MAETSARRSVLDQTAAHVRALLAGDSTGHDGSHVVRATARHGRK
jgi:hypothetical protein